MFPFFAMFIFMMFRRLGLFVVFDFLVVLRGMMTVAPYVIVRVHNGGVAFHSPVGVAAATGAYDCEKEREGCSCGESENPFHKSVFFFNTFALLVKFIAAREINSCRDILNRVAAAVDVSVDYSYFVTRSSQLTIANITPMEIRQTLRNTVHATQIGQAL